MNDRTDWKGAAFCIAVVIGYVAGMLFVGGW